MEPNLAAIDTIVGRVASAMLAMGGGSSKTSTPVKTLVIGGTGLISHGILKGLRERGSEVDVISRRQADLGPGVRLLRADRSDAAALATAASAGYDAVIDMIAFSPDDATIAIYRTRDLKPDPDQ